MGQPTPLWDSVRSMMAEAAILGAVSIDGMPSPPPPHRI